jgi:hypothetical protein
MRYKSITNGINYFLIGTLVYFISLHIFSYYVLGDQLHYIRLYNSISAVEYNEVGMIAYKTIGAKEPLSLILLWLGSNFFSIDKEIWVSLLNSLFIVLFYRFLVKNNTPFIIIILLMISFYILVLLFSAERLKFAFLAIFFALNTTGKTRNIFFLISPLFHYQVLAFFPIIFLYKYGDQLKNIFFKLKISKYLFIELIVIIISMILIVTLNYDSFMHKFDAYFFREKSINAQLNTFFKIAIFTSVAMIELKDRFKVGLCFIPFFIFGFMFGGQRIVIMAFALFVYLLVIEGKLKRPLPVIILIYFSVKAYPFIQNIYNCGSGFLVNSCSYKPIFLF